MSFQLRKNEEIVTAAQFHWSMYIRPAAVAFILSMGAIGYLRVHGFNFMTVLLLCAAVAPVLYRWVIQKTKKYIVTNQRIYLEEGIIAKAKVELPLSKVNDVSTRQGILQRIFGSGNVLVFTGNDKPTVLKDIDQPDEFREKLAAQVAKKAAA